MTSRFRPLLPAQSYRAPPNPAVSTEPPKRRSAVQVACTACQKAKSKCSGDRPICVRCKRKSLVCEYDIEPNQSRAATRRESEEQLRELYSHLQSRPWDEAIEILRRIRGTADPLEVASLVRAGDILIGRPMHEEGSAAAAESHEATARFAARAVPRLTSPWTVIADRDTVRSLVDIFFEMDQWFLMPFIDQDVFLKDMQEPPQQPQDGRFCSALLVNALCSFAACYGSIAMERDRASRVGLGESFFAEAKRLANFENGRPSIPAVQALLVMFSYSCRMGRDRAGSIFRASAYEMMVRMMPRIQSTLSNGNYPSKTRRAISRATCGIFCFDRSAAHPPLPTWLLAAPSHRRLTTPSLCSSAYLRPSLFSALEVPLLVAAVEQMQHVERGVGSEEPSVAPLAHEREEFLAIKHAYELSDVLNRALLLARKLNGNESTDTFISQLAQLYQMLQELQSNYPGEDEYQGIHEREHGHLWAYHHLVAAHVMRLLQREKTHPLQWKVERPKDICIWHCQGIIKHVDRHFIRYPSDRQNSLVALYFAYTCTIILLGLLDGNSPAVVETFSRGCRIFYEATDLPLASLLLEGLAAAADHIGVQLPPSVVPYFDEVKGARRPDRGDVPLGFVVPFRDQPTLVGNGEWVWYLEAAGIELGDLLGFDKRTSTE